MTGPMKLITKWSIAGFVFGLAFAAVHLPLLDFYFDIPFNLPYNIPLYIILSWMGQLFVCDGFRGCFPYILVAVVVSSVFWGLVGLVIGKIVTRTHSSSSSDMPEAGPGEGF